MTQLPPETIALAQALNRTLATPVIASNVPPHPIAALTGHAVRAADADGASDYVPLPISATPVDAGARLPPGTDAVLPPALTDGALAYAPIPPGENVIPTGHHARAGNVIPAGTLLTPLHLALLHTLGHASIEATRQPRTPPSGPLLDTLVAQNGGIAGTPADLSLDHLPPDPIAAATTFILTVAPVLRQLAGRPEPTPLSATLARKVTSALGQHDAILVHLANGIATPLTPAEGGSLTAALSANAILLVPAAREGYPEGAIVQLLPF